MNFPKQEYSEASNTDTFEPHVTVATVVERDGKYLLVEEKSHGEIVYNQPAGHLEANEDLIQAAVRETLEETGWHVDISGVLSINLYRSPNNGVTYHRTTLIGNAVIHDTNRELDEGIIRAVWMSPEEALGCQHKHRSPLVMRAIDTHASGTRYPLSMLEALL